MASSGQKARSRTNGRRGGRSRPTGRRSQRALPELTEGEHYHPSRSDRGGEGLANFLGWFSIGLGAAQLLVPDRVADVVGMESGPRSRRAMRALGMREVASGVGILSRRRPAGWVWSRVAGDAMDIALLTGLMTDEDNRRGRTAAATAAVAAVTVLDVLAARRLSNGDDDEEEDDEESLAYGESDGAPARDVERTRLSITVRKSPEEVYEFWHDFENLPRFMRNLESVEVIDEKRSHWVATGPGGTTVEWDAEITADIPNELIAWRSVDDADVYNAGRVQFRTAPGGRGTEIRVELAYDPPAGKFGAGIAKLFRKNPEQQVRDDLRRFKQVIETGEVVASDASIHEGPHPAQPAEMEEVAR
jgi:uncharacterized membrane protein